MRGFWSYNSLNLPSTRLPADESKWPPKAYRRVHFGQHVLWQEFDDDNNLINGGRHLDANTLEPYRQFGDEVIDNILDLYAKEGRPLRPGDDLLERLPMVGEECKTASFSQADKALKDALDQYSQLPSWVDKAQLKRGQDVFLAYLPAIGASLYYRSLVPGFSIPKIAAVLHATAYLAPPASRTAVHERLLDTGAFLGSCLQSENVDGILPHGHGWKAALRVRVLHAKVRRKLLNRKAGNTSWDTTQLGVPINQEDLAATLLAFSSNSLLGAEMLLGRPLPLQDQLDYLALWRYLGWLLGIDVKDEEGTSSRRTTTTTTTTRTPKKPIRALDPCGPGWYPTKPNPGEHSYAIFQSIIMHNLHPDESSTSMALHLLRLGRPQKGGVKKHKKDRSATTAEATTTTSIADGFLFYFRCFQCRRFVGDELADALKLPLPPSLWGRLVQGVFSNLYLTFLTFYTIAGLPFSPLRQMIIRFHRNNMNVFMNHWTQAHLDRMRNKLRVKEEENNGSAAVCPFAMVTSNE